MDKQEQVEQLTNYVAHFVAHTAKVLPDDVIAKLDEMAEKESFYLRFYFPYIDIIDRFC